MIGRESHKRVCGSRPRESMCCVCEVVAPVQMYFGSLCPVCLNEFPSIHRSDNLPQRKGGFCSRCGQKDTIEFVVAHLCRPCGAHFLGVPQSEIASSDDAASEKSKGEKMKKQSKPSRIWSDSKRSHSPWEQQTRTDAAYKAAQKRNRKNGK
jgi:hypothetical protein